MDLDNPTRYREIDQTGMLAHIYGLPAQLDSAWRMGLQNPIPDIENPQAIILAGMGGSAIGADLLVSYLSGLLSIPVLVLREYSLPGWAKGKQVLVVACSHSGNTEETLSVYEQALQQGCTVLSISTGGTLARRAKEEKQIHWSFVHEGQPRAAVGFSFGLLLALLQRLLNLTDHSSSISSTVAAMEKLAEELAITVPVQHNPAKRLAGQLMGRSITVMSADYLCPVARRWKTQINELAKVWAEFDFISEADHNTLAGIVLPEEALSKLMVLFIRGSSNHPRNRLRIELTRKEFMLAGINTELVEFKQENPLAEIWTGLLYGDYLSYYLAIAYGIDPTPIDSIQELKKAMK